MESQPDSELIRELLDQFLDSLCPENRMIFVRRYWFGDSIAQIAQHFRISQSKVKMRLLRARKHLAEFLDKEDIVL